MYLFQLQVTFDACVLGGRDIRVPRRRASIAASLTSSPPPVCGGRGPPHPCCDPDEVERAALLAGGTFVRWRTLLGGRSMFRVMMAWRCCSNCNPVRADCSSGVLQWGARTHVSEDAAFLKFSFNTSSAGCFRGYQQGKSKNWPVNGVCTVLSILNILLPRTTATCTKIPTLSKCEQL